MGRVKHQVVGQHPEVALPLPGRLGSPDEGTSKPSLVSGEGGLHLPPLAVHPEVPAPFGFLPKPLDHLPPVRSLGPLAAMPAAFQGDHSGPHAEVVPVVPVVGLGI